MDKDSILKATPLTYSVLPSKLQQQNVEHALNVFNVKVVATQPLAKQDGTADFYTISVDVEEHCSGIIKGTGYPLERSQPGCLRSIFCEPSEATLTYLD